MAIYHDHLHPRASDGRFTPKGYGEARDGVEADLGRQETLIPGSPQQQTLQQAMTAMVTQRAAADLARRQRHTSNPGAAAMETYETSRDRYVSKPTWRDKLSDWWAGR